MMDKRSFFAPLYHKTVNNSTFSRQITPKACPFARSATSLMRIRLRMIASLHLPKATSFAPTVQHRSFVPRGGNDVLASLEMMLRVPRK
jgi:hypothetical protein